VDKAPDAFRTISEVADDLDVPQHVLRFWETKFSQIKPLKRAGGRRYYRPEDIDLLRGIRVLLYTDGFTIKGVQKVFRDQGVRVVAESGRAKGANGSKVAKLHTAVAQAPTLPLEAKAKAADAKPDHGKAEAKGDGKVGPALEQVLAQLVEAKSLLSRRKTHAAPARSPAAPRSA
jgi:DNA-binding transcriptional MerR regulator